MEYRAVNLKRTCLKNNLKFTALNQGRICGQREENIEKIGKKFEKYENRK